MARTTLKLKVYSTPMGVHFKKYEPKEGEKYIPCYKDIRIKDAVIEDNAIAILREPRAIQKSVCDYIEHHYDRFKYVFTHDSKLLATLPNAKPIIWAGIWHWSDCPKDFEHPISIVAPELAQAPLKVLRKQMAFDLQGKIDCYGTYNGGKWADCSEYLEKYPFSIVIENYIDDLWFTEKICNCFANNVIPIYYGSEKINEYFNADGIIQVHSRSEIESIIDYLLLHGEEEYNKRRKAMADNRKRVKKYEKFETWFMNKYRKLLKGLV